MHNEVIWIVKDGQRIQVGAWFHGHHDKLLKFLPQFLTIMSCYCRHTVQRSSQPQDDNTIFRRAARNPCWEKLPIMSKTWAWIDLWYSTNEHESEVKHKSKAEDFTTKKITLLTGNLHKLMWALAQRSCSSVIIITRWHLHVQVFAVGESTGDESTYCIIIQRMPTWNSRKSRSTTNCRLKTSVHKAFKESTAWVQLMVEFNEMNMMALQTRL